MKISPVSVAIVSMILPILAQVQQSQAPAGCICEIDNSRLTFPQSRLLNVQSGASDCTKKITSQEMSDVDILLDKLHYRLQQLELDVLKLEEEDDSNGSAQQADLYMAVSLRIIEIELAEIQDLIIKLNTTNTNHQGLSKDFTTKLQNMKTEMEALEKFDRTGVVEKEKVNKQLQKELVQCQADLQVTPAPSIEHVPGNCSHGHLLNVTGPNTYAATEYGTSYPFGAWGHDPKPAAGKENWYWLVVLTSSSVYSNFIRWYSSHSTLVVGSNAGDVIIASGNPTTNTVQGPNVVMYGDALYYGCYNSPNLCRFNMTARTITTVALPNVGYNNKFPFCHLGACYTYTDIDVATDESGVWVVYATAENFGNVVLSKVESGITPLLGHTWNTSLHKRTVTNTFVACGVLYATRFLDKDTEEIFYSLDTVTGQERYDLNLRFRKMSTNIHSLNYNPNDRQLYMYSDAYVLTYQLVFG